MRRSSQRIAFRALIASRHGPCLAACWALSSRLVSCEVAAIEHRRPSSITEILAQSAPDTSANDAEVSLVSMSSMPAPLANAPASSVIVD